MGQSIGPSFLRCMARPVSPGGRVRSSRGGRRLRVPGVLSGAPPRWSSLHSPLPAPHPWQCSLDSLGPAPGHWAPMVWQMSFLQPGDCGGRNVACAQPCVEQVPLGAALGAQPHSRRVGTYPGFQCRVPQVGSAPRTDRRFLTPTPCCNYAKVSIWLGGGLRDPTHHGSSGYAQRHWRGAELACSSA